MSVGPTAARPWFVDRAGGGGNILERGSHQIDLQRAVAGEVTSVQVTASDVLLAQSAGGEGDIEEDAATIVLRFESGAVGTIMLGVKREGLPGSYSLDVVASEGTLKLKLDPAFTVTGQVRERRVKSSMTVHPFERSISRFAEAVHAGDPGAVFCTPADAIGTLATALAGERSVLEGGRVVELSELLPG